MLSVILESLGTSLAIMAAVLGVFLVGSVFWVRSAVKNRTYCFFLAENKQLSGKLLKATSNMIKVGSGDAATAYIAHPSKEFWSFWPPGFPRFIQEPVPTLFFVEDNAEPLDPYDRKSLITPQSLMKVSDEAMLKQTWKDVKESMGLKGQPKSDKMLLLLILAAIGMSTIAAYMSFSNVSQLTEITRLLGG